MSEESGKSLENSSDAVERPNGFTKGPWEFSGSDSMPLLHIYAPDNKHVFHGDRSLREHEANARLMAAAPDLLEALKALDACYCEASDEMSRAQRDHHRKVLIAARAAIAKALGQ